MWEIYAYHNNEVLAGIFNAIAAIMASGTYLSAIAVVAFCGFIAAMVAAVVDPSKLYGWKWIATVVLVYGILFVPRVNVAVVDKTGGAPNRIVANVPFGMAVLGSLTSTVGNTVTELFETAFQVLPGPSQLPVELSYQRNGIMFGSRMLQETRRVAIPDPMVRTDLMNFVQNCTAYDIADGTISPTAFSQSADLWAMMAFTNPARFSIITNAAGVTTNTCDQVYAAIDARLPAQLNDLQAKLGLRLNPSLAPVAANAAVAAQITQGYIRSQIAGAAATAADLIRQNAMINAINDAGEMGCQKINDPSCMMLASGRASAVAAQNAAWINGAKIAEQALPVVRNVAESMMYAVFPLVVLLLFITSSKTTFMMLGGYAAALISIQLWPPLFAILNYMASIYAQLDQAAAAEIGGGVKALSLSTASPIYSNAISSQAVVSYLIIGIPALAYSLANRLVNFGSSVMGGLQGLQTASMSGNASAAAAVGNANMGNVTMDQRVVSPSTSNPFVSRDQTEEGDWITTTKSGVQATSFLRNEGAVSRVVSTSVSDGMVTEASRAVEAARTSAVSASKELSSTLVDTMSTSSSKFRGSTQTSGQALSSVEEVGRSADQLRVMSEQLSNGTGLTASQFADIAFRLSAGGGLPFVSGTASGGKAYRGDLTQQEQIVASKLNTDQLRQFKSFADRATRDQAFIRSLGAESRDGQELASRLSQATSRVESTQAALSERTATAERLSAARSNNEVLSVDLAQLPANSAFLHKWQQLSREYGSDSQALQAALASELAQRSLRPTVSQSGGALPITFGEVRAAHASDLQNPLLDSSNVRDADAANDRAASPRLGAVRPGAPGGLPGQSGVRDELNARSADGARQPALQQDFDKRNEIVRNPDGTVSTRKSLVVGNAKQLRDDVSAMADNAVDAMTSGAQRAEQAAGAARESQAGSQRNRDIQATPEVPPMLPKSGRRTPK